MIQISGQCTQDAPTLEAASIRNFSKKDPERGVISKISIKFCKISNYGAASLVGVGRLGLKQNTILL